MPRQELYRGLKPWMEDLKSPDAVMRVTAVGRLTELGPSALPILGGMLIRKERDRNHKVREAAACVVGVVGIEHPGEAGEEAKIILAQAKREEQRELTNARARLRQITASDDYRQRAGTLAERKRFVTQTIDASLRKLSEN